MVEYLQSPQGGWNPDENPWEMAGSQAPVLDNALIRPGKVLVRGSLANWADLSAITTPVPPLNVCGIQPVPGSAKLAIGRKATSSTAFVEPWFAPIVRPTTAAAIAAPTADLAVSSGGTTLTNTATAANLIPGPRGISFEGTRLFLSYGTASAPVLDASGTYYGQTTSLCALPSSGVPTAYTNAPTGGIDIKGYQQRIWVLGGYSSLGAGAALGTGTFNPLTLYFSNTLAPGGGNTAAFADWKDTVTGNLNYITMDGDTTDPGVGLATVRNGLIILRYGSIWLLKGSTTANYALVPVSRDVGCIDPRSIVETDHGVYFMSKQGLMLTNGTTVANVSGTATHTLQNAVEMILNGIKSSFGGYITCAVTSNGQIVVSMGVPSVTAGAPDGHIQPVWCAMYDPDVKGGTWTRITSALFTADATIITPGNNYPGWVFTTPDKRFLSIGDKYITLWESEAASTQVTTLTAGPSNPTAAANDAAVGTTAWTNPTNAEAADGVYATVSDGANSAKYNGTLPTQGSDGTGGLTWSIVNDTGSGLGQSSCNNGTGSSQFTPSLLIEGFGFSIPAGATIRGIQVDHFVSSSAGLGVGAATDNNVQLLKAGGAVGSNHASGATWTGQVQTYGGPTDLWGTTWTPADINNATFGFVVRAALPTGTSQVQCQNHHVTVYYSVGSQMLKATGYGFAIPSTATVVGIQASVTRKSGAGHIIDTNVQLYKAGVLQGTNRSAGAAWSTSNGAVSFGGSADLWGGTWAPADINNVGFGVGVAAASDGNADTASVDVIQITVYYTLSNTTAQQSFVKNPGLYDKDAAGNYQPIPFVWVTRFIPVVGTTTLTRKFGQMKRYFIDYVFQGIGLPSANGFTVTPITATGATITGASALSLAPTNNSMSASSISGGQPNAATSIQRRNQDLSSEISDLSFQITFADAQQSSQPSYVAAEVYGIGIEYQPTRDQR